MVINSTEELTQHIQYSANGCALLKDQLDIDFSKYTLLIGKKKLNSVQGILISQSIKKDCDNEKYIYKVSVKNGGYTALGSIIYGVIIQKTRANAIIVPEISVLD